MLKSLLVLALFIVNSIAYGETVYKCKDTQGDTLYSDEPCPDAQELQLDIEGSYTGAGGLRPSEKASLQSFDKQNAEAANTERRSQDDELNAVGCAGINILSGKLKTYVYQGMGGGRYIVQNRCVQARVSLGGAYGGSFINDSSRQQDIRQRFSGTFADGRTEAARVIKFSTGPDRISPDARYEIEVCFGGSESELISFRCQ